MRQTRSSRFPHRAQTALGLVALLLAGIRAAHAVPLTHARFQLRAECTCASCGFALQDQLRKLPGVTRVDLSPRERVVALTFDESRAPLSKVAASLAGTEMGKHSALIGDLIGGATAAEAAAAAAKIAGVRAAEVDKKGQLLIDLAEGTSLTTADLAAALARAGIAARFDHDARTARATAPVRAAEPDSRPPAR